MLQVISVRFVVNNENLCIQIDGTIIAPDEPKNWDPKNPRIWLYFSNLTGVTFQGHGVIDGSGKKWWAASCKKNKTKVQYLKYPFFICL